MIIVCFGDSVTRGISYVKGRLRIIRDNYPSLLQKAFDSVAVVVNKGVFNDNSDLLAARLQQDVLDEKPDYVLIEIGGNDCNFKWQEVSERPEREHESIVPLQKYLTNITRMIDEIRKVGAVPVVLNLLPLDPVRYYRQLCELYGPSISHWIARCGGIEHWHGLYNRALQQLVEVLDVTYIDLRNAFKASGDLHDLLSDDGIHPSEEGYRVMSDIIRSKLAPCLAH